MTRITTLKTLQILLLIVIGCLIAFRHPEWSFKDFIMPLIIMTLCTGVGYIDRMIDEEKEE